MKKITVDLGKLERIAQPKTQKQMLVNYVMKKIEENKKRLDELELLPIDLLSQAFPEATFGLEWSWYFEMQLPMRQTLIEEVKRFVKEQFPEWEIDNERQIVWDEAKSAGFFIEYLVQKSTKETGWKRLEFHVAFRSSKSGSTCVLNKIGEKTVPVYEAVCSEEAAKEFTIEKEGQS